MRGAGVGLNRTKESDMTHDKGEPFGAEEEAQAAEFRAWMKREGIGLDELIDLLDLYVPVTPPVYVPLKAPDKSPWVADPLPNSK
jgi:hypothetical protein